MSRSKRRPIPRYQTPLIETHCHLDYLEGPADSGQTLAQTLADAAAAGVERIVTIAVSADNLDTVVEFSTRDARIWGTQGIHPHQAAQLDAAVLERIAANLEQPRMVAVGEIGLDYYYTHSEPAVQRSAFAQQLELAARHDLPVVIHSRDADEDTIAILREHLPALSRRGVIHSFTSGEALARFSLESGFMLGFNGITTFRNADNVRAIVALTPVEQLVLETDAPYLTPVPYRGRPNAPCYLPFVAEQIAEIKQLPVEALLAQVHHNSMQLFFASELREWEPAASG